MNEFDYLAQLPGEERERAWMRERLETLSVREGIILAAAVQRKPPASMADAINLAGTLDYYRIMCGAGSYERLGEYYLDVCNGVPDDALPYVDLTQIGKHYTTLHPGQFVGGNYVAYPNIAAAPAYQGHDAPLPEDRGWTAKLRIASPAVPEGVWMRLPWLTGVGDYTSLEEEVTLKELRAQGWAECTLLDTRCVVPEVGSLMEQYSDVGDLIGDSLCLDDALRWQVEDGQWYPAALRLENCQTLKLALDIAQNPDCYDWRPRSELKSAAVEALSESEISGNLIQTGGIDLCGYGAHLLEAQGYVLAEDGSGCIARTCQEFHYNYSTPAPEESGMAMR